MTHKNSAEGTSCQIVLDLQNLLDANSEIKETLIYSLTTASATAKTSLDTQLYKGLDEAFNGNAWPMNLDTYYKYLELFVRLIPNEEISKEYPDAWKSNPSINGVNQKVYDFLCHFYWLINQREPESKNTMQSYSDFAAWLVKFANCWGEFCDTTESLTPASKASFKANPMYNWDLYSDNESTWTTFNEFFSREFNNFNCKTGKTPLRPITGANDNNIITSPADCTFKANYPIDENGNVTNEVGDKTTLKLKHSHTIGTIHDLLDDSEYAKYFNGGTFIHYFLGPFDYHRFHTPVSGKILEIRAISGNVYLNVNISEDQFHAPDGATNGYEFSQSRGLVIMENDELGKVAILPIGMCQVSGVRMHTHLQGSEVFKGQEFGKFVFGGSDIIMLFEKKPEDLYMYKKDPGHNAIHFQYGQAAILVKTSEE